MHRHTPGRSNAIDLVQHEPSRGGPAGTDGVKNTTSVSERAAGAANDGAAKESIVAAKIEAIDPSRASIATLQRMVMARGILLA
jgi:hypothetical protein